MTETFLCLHGAKNVVISRLQIVFEIFALILIIYLMIFLFSSVQIYRTTESICNFCIVSLWFQTEADKIKFLISSRFLEHHFVTREYISIHHPGLYLFPVPCLASEFSQIFMKKSENKEERSTVGEMIKCSGL